MKEAPIVSSPKISILMLAYNVDQYVADALDSVLMQEVDHTYEIVIGEDCSTDRTAEIIAAYARRHPDKFRPIYRQQNLGMNQNFVSTLEECRGQYIAILDGDDYWTSSKKLQQQADFLDAHPECSVCFHNVNVVYQDGRNEAHPFYMDKPLYRLSSSIPESLTKLEDIVHHNYLLTCAVMFRRGLFDSLPEWFCSMPGFDWPLHILNAKYGQIAYLDYIWAVYRVHTGGHWSMQMSTYGSLEDVEEMINAYSLIDQYFEGRYGKLLEGPVIPLYWKAARILFDEARYLESASYSARWLRGLVAFHNGPQRRLVLQRAREWIYFKMVGMRRRLRTRLSGI